MVHRGLLAERRDERLRMVDFGASTGALALGAYSFALSSVRLRAAFDEKLTSFLGSPEHLEIAERYGFSNAEIARVKSA
jgi:hypothetical protein